MPVHYKDVNITSCLASSWGNCVDRAINLEHINRVGKIGKTAYTGKADLGNEDRAVRIKPEDLEKFIREKRIGRK